jgi:hypothetical protein
MAKAIRQIGLKLVASLLRVFERPAPAGWRRSARPLSLADR